MLRHILLILNYSTLRPLSHRNKNGINLAPVPYNVTQFVVVDHAYDGLLPNTDHYLLMETIVRFSKMSAPKPSHDTPKVNQNPVLQVW